MGVAHTQHGFVEINALCGYSAPSELVHNEVIGLVCVEATCLLGVERCDTVQQSFLYEVVAKVHKVVAAYGNSHIKRTCPVAVGNHFEHHNVALHQSVLTYERDSHTVWNAVGGHHHATAAHCSLVDGHIQRVGRYAVELRVARTHPVFQHVFQFEWVGTELLSCLFRVLLV